MKGTDKNEVGYNIGGAGPDIIFGVPDDDEDLIFDDIDIEEGNIEVDEVEEDNRTTLGDLDALRALRDQLSNEGH